MSKWISVRDNPPADGVVVLTAIIDERGERNTQELKKSDSLWFFPDDSMYVYYTPTHWKEQP